MRRQTGSMTMPNRLKRDTSTPTGYVAAAAHSHFDGDAGAFFNALPGWLEPKAAHVFWCQGDGRPDAYLATCAAIGCDPLTPWHAPRSQYPSGPLELALLGSCVRTLRRDLGLTLKGIAEDIGTTSAALCILERGRGYRIGQQPPASTMVAVCLLLAIDPHTFCRRVVDARSLAAAHQDRVLEASA